MPAKGRQHPGGEADRVVADRDDRQPLHRLLQPKLHRRALVHRPQHLDVPRLVRHVDAGAEQVGGALGPAGQVGQPLLGGAAGAHRRVEAPHHELAEQLTAADALLAQHLDALVDDRLVGPGGAEAEGAGRGEMLDLGGDLQEPVEGLRLVAALGGHARDHLGELAVEARHCRGHLAGGRQGQERHRPVGLDLEHPLHDASEPAPADPRHRQHREAAVPVLVDAEVAGDHRLAVDHPGDREALGHEPLREVLGDDGIDGVALGAVDADEAGGDDQARGRGQPVLGEQRRHLAGERRLGQAVEEQRVGDELGVHLPLQEAAAEGSRIVARTGRRMRRAVAVEQRRKMRAVALAVAPGGVALGLDREVQRAAGRGQLRKRPGVQLVGQGVAVGVVVEGELRHGGLSGDGGWRHPTRGVRDSHPEAAMLQRSVPRQTHRLARRSKAAGDCLYRSWVAPRDRTAWMEWREVDSRPVAINCKARVTRRDR